MYFLAFITSCALINTFITHVSLDSSSEKETHLLVADKSSWQVVNRTVSLGHGHVETAKQDPSDELNDIEPQPAHHNPLLVNNESLILYEPNDPEASRDSGKEHAFPIPPVNLTSLPSWILNYFDWHREMRAQYPDLELFNNETAPPLLIRTCSASERCGGLHDRLGKLAWDLYLANQTQRVYLIHWCKPCPLQEYLLPRYINWTVPAIDFTLYMGFRDSGSCSGRLNRWKDLYHKLPSDRPKPSFWESGFDFGLERAKSEIFKDIKILKSRVIGGNETFLKQKLKEAGDDGQWFGDWSLQVDGHLFWSFFQPSPALWSLLDDTYSRLSLQPRSYSAVHCRVRHPKALSLKSNFQQPKNETIGGPDKSGLLWEGKSKDFAISTAAKALHCMRKVSELPVYFYADSEELVNTMSSKDVTEELPNEISSLLSASVKQANIVQRSVTSETLHIDRQQGHAPMKYAPSFLDLFVAVQAKCIAMGVGNFAFFAAKLSTSKCLIQYEGEAWGDEGIKNGISTQCELEE